MINANEVIKETDELQVEPLKKHEGVSIVRGFHFSFYVKEVNKKEFLNVFYKLRDEKNAEIEKAIYKGNDKLEERNSDLAIQNTVSDFIKKIHKAYNKIEYGM